MPHVNIQLCNFIDNELNDKIIDIVLDYSDFISKSKDYYNRSYSNTNEAIKNMNELMTRYDRLKRKAKNYGFEINNLGSNENVVELYFHKYPILYLVVDIEKLCLVDTTEVKSNLPYTRLSKELNDKIAELMDDYNAFIAKAKRYGLDVKFAPSSRNTLELYFNDDYPEQLLVDKDISCSRISN